MKTISLNGLEITKYQQSSIKIKTHNLIIYLDPYKVTDEPGDLILITHEHFDHFDKVSIFKLQKEKTLVIAPEYLASRIAGNVRGIKAGETLEVLKTKLSTYSSYNIGKSYHPKERGDLSFLIEIMGKRIFFSGDSDKTPEMEGLENIDLAFLPIGDTYTMSEEEAAQAVAVIKPKIVIPMHYGQIAGGGDPQKFASLVGENAKVMILE